MTDIWESTPLVVEVWESQTTPGVVWSTVVRDGETVSGVQSIVAGTNVTVDATDPAHPIVSATGGGDGIPAHVLWVSFDVSGVGGSWSGTDLTIAAFAGYVPDGGLILLSGQADPSRDGSYVSVDTSTGAFARNGTQYVDLAHAGQTIGVAVNIATGVGAVLLISAEGGQPVLVPQASTASVTSAVGAHDTSGTAHADIRASVGGGRPVLATVGDGFGWQTPFNSSAFTGGGIDLRCDATVTGPPTGDWAPGVVAGFAELITQTHDSGGGSWDNFEWARVFGARTGGLGDELDDDVIYDFFEMTPQGASAESAFIICDLGVKLGVSVKARLTVDFSTGTVRVWVESSVPADDTTADGRHWTLKHEEVVPSWTSIDSGVTEPLSIGQRLAGWTDKAEIFNGIDGTLLASPSATDGALGSKSIVDAQSNPWTTDTGVLRAMSAGERLASLELAPSGAVRSVTAGTGIAVDNTDPDNPVVSASGGGSEIWHQNILCPLGYARSGRDASGGLPYTPAVVADSGSLLGGLLRTSDSFCWVEWDVWLDAGTWGVTVTHLRNASGGVGGLLVAGVEVAEVNFYDPSSVRNVATSAAFTVASSGKKVIRVAYKSGATNMSLQAIQFRRTA